MNRINILLIHRDNEYARALCRALMLKDAIFSVIVPEEEKPAISKTQELLTEDKYDIFLTDEDVKKQADLGEHPNRMKIFGLTETPTTEKGKGYIFKYGGLDQIASEIQIAYGDNSGIKRICLNKNKTNIIGFTSNAGGVGKSSVAISVAKELTLTKRTRILYLSFEETESTAVYLPMDNGRATISEYLYYLFKDENKAISCYTDAFTITDSQGLTAFRPAKGRNELPELDCNQQLRFFDTIIESTHFEYLFIDFPFNGAQATRQLIYLCRTLFIIDDGTPLSINKNERFIAEISQEIPCLSIENAFGKTSGAGDKRIIAVTNKWEPSKEFTTGKDRLYVEYDPESFEFTDSKINISLQRRFGIGIRRIADEIAACI